MGSRGYCLCIFVQYSLVARKGYAQKMNIVLRFETQNIQLS